MRQEKDSRKETQKGNSSRVDDELDAEVIDGSLLRWRPAHLIRNATKLCAQGHHSRNKMAE